MTSRQYSSYFDQLDSKAKARYEAKLDIIGPNFDDPYTLTAAASSDSMPEVEYPDIYNYLVNTPSPYTKEDLKAYKNLDGYKYLLAGWVGDLSVYNLSSGNFVVKAKVRHSQTVLAQPTQPWVTAEPKRTVLAAHCTCMAGLCEVCSHVVALLFTLEAHTKYKQKISCTSEPCK